MPVVPGPGLLRRCALAEVVHQRGEAYFGFGGNRSRLVERHQRVHAAVDFRVMAFRLRDSEQAIDFGKQGGQRVAFPERFKISPRLPGLQCLFRFNPDALRRQRLQFIRGADVL